MSFQVRLTMINILDKDGNMYMKKKKIWLD